jgi:hypothetical protein
MPSGGGSIADLAGNGSPSVGQCWGRWLPERQPAAFSRGPSFYPFKVVGQHIFAASARPPVGLENEEAWLRARIIRLRRLLRYVKDAQVEAGLKEFIGDAEARLDKLERKRLRLIDDEPPGG